ncbi:sacsin N-terminal ATP-binding-like domain-containing protein [Pedobacter sp. ASV28]|uniref:sacsin N-terminal ATP-binding-like domain-containing protein n=1 Tax=Pedobacter sp. ASV28 TaxID=2795123 RepID=UPI0018EBDD66
MYKEFVDKIHQEKAKNDSNSRDLAHSLNVLSKTVFGEVNRFIFELLQNADDSSSDGSPINVQFKLLENYLVFSHDGKHFTKEDVQGISGIGNRASEKDKNVEKTGYKGIGFKSVFGSSDYAHIVSGGFSFRFDKNFEGYHGSEEFPWQVVPIWTDQPAREVAECYDQKRVNTIIHISDRKNIKKEIINVFEDCQIILFLRKVKTVTLFDGDTKIFEVTKEVADGVVDLYNGGRLESSWILKTMDLAINDALSLKLKDLSETACPQKLKEAKATKLTFAAKVKDQQIVPVERAVIYSYLPTKAKKDFPFLINGDFLTNAERTELMPNIWNEFLFREIAVRQLEWFRELQDTEYRFDVLSLLNGKYPDYSDSVIDLAYNESLEAAAATVDFLPVQHEEGRTVVIKAAIVDNPGFSEYFRPSTITGYLEITGTHNVLDLRLKNQAKLKSLGAISFTFPELLGLIESKAINDVAGAIETIRFFYNKTLNGKNQTWLLPLESAAFIMDESGEYKTPKEIFIPAQTAVADVAFSLSYVHADILARYASAPQVLVWLQNLGVREPTDLEVVKKSIIPMIANGGVNQQNVMAVTRFVFKVFRAKQLSDKDYSDLRMLEVLTVNGLKIPSQCYFSDDYVPEKKLSSVLPHANFLVNDYIEDSADVLDWKTFFKKIGVRENISIELIEEKIERQAFERQHPEASRYFSWLDKIEAYPSLYHPWRNSGQHYIQNYTSIEFRLSLLEPAFSKFFWGKMLDNWDNFISKCDITKYFRLGGSDTVPSYIQYYIENFECIPCTDGKCYRCGDVFAPTLKSVIGKHLPVADLPVSMTVEQLSFFKFKRNISPEECLKLLGLISSEPLGSETNRQLFSIYDQLTGTPTNVVRLLRSTINEWKASGCLLNTDNNFQPVSDLYVFGLHNTQPPMGSNRFLKVASRSKDEISALADFFGLQQITEDLLEFVPVDAIENTEIRQALLERTPHLALIYSKKSTEDYRKILSRIVTSLQNTTFINASSLSLVYKDKGQVIVDSKIDCWPGKSGEFYFTGKWNSPITVYSLSGSLCDLLNMEGMAREFGLVMQLSPKDIHLWLTEQGYPVSEISEGDDLFKAAAVEASIDHTDAESPFTGVDIAFENVFTPELNVEDINFKNVTAVVNNLSQVTISTNKTYQPIENSQVKIDIGRWSEEYVNRYLHENSERFTEIIWHNENSESYLPYDFTVKENGIPKCIEVKGTPSQTKEMIKLSLEEWKQMFAHGNNYSIFRVYGAGLTKYNRLEINDNIRREIETGKLLDFPMEIFLP